MKQIKIKRVYDKISKDDGVRILVDRVWPRGLKKDNLKFDYWFKDIAPSTELRKWFAHDPVRWGEFKKKYFREIKKNKSLCNEILKNGDCITLLYSARDIERNQAVALKEFLEKEF